MHFSKLFNKTFSIDDFKEMICVDDCFICKAKLSLRSCGNKFIDESDYSDGALSLKCDECNFLYRFFDEVDNNEYCIDTVSFQIGDKSIVIYKSDLNDKMLFVIRIKGFNVIGNMELNNDISYERIISLFNNSDKLLLLK